MGRLAGGAEALHCVWVAEDHRVICSMYPHPVSIGDGGFMPYPSAAVECYCLSRIVRVLQ